MAWVGGMSDNPYGAFFQPLLCGYQVIPWIGCDLQWNQLWANLLMKTSGQDSSTESFPETLLDVRIHFLDPKLGLTGLCAGYEQTTWRSEELSRHLIEWLPDFALTYQERQALAAHNAVRQIRKAAQIIYNSPKYGQRGELGELLLHVALRQVFGTLPAVSKIYFKDSANDTVKGFDAVHVIAGDQSLELRIGESKFFADVASAINAAVASLQEHTGHEYLRREFAAIVNKIDGTWPHSERLKKLLDPNTSLDTVFDAMCIPVFLSYDSPVVQEFSEVTEEFISQLRAELCSHHETFRSKQLPHNIRLHLFLFPMGMKKNLVDAFDTRLKQWQTM